MKIPKDFPVRPLGDKEIDTASATCLTCGRSWDDSISTSYTPAPGGRCPFEAFHDIDSEKPRNTFEGVNLKNKRPQTYSVTGLTEEEITILHNLLLRLRLGEVEQAEKDVVNKIIRQIEE